jgi:hypothetical protein
VGAAGLVAGVVAQLQEVLDVGVPGSRYTQAAPLRLPPWLTAATEESSVFSHGTMPLLWPLVDLISEPRERTRCSSRRCRR